MTMLPTYFPSPPQGVWHLGPLPIRAYAMFIIAGIVVALMIGDRRWAARGGQRGVIYDIALWVVPFGLIGGRLYHLATDWRTYWGPGGAGFGAAARIWDGGLGIWGAVALGVLGAWIGCRRRGMPLPAFLDALAPGVILAQAIGRLGNYFNQELYGRETTLPWGLEIFYRRDPSGYIDPHSLDGVSTGQLAVVVQPTFLYELLWNVLVSVILIYIDRRYAIGHGRLFASYVALYCVGRFWVELLRDDTATHIAGIRINSFTSTFVFIGAVVYIVLAPKGRVLAPKGREDPESLRGKDYAAEEKSEPEKEPAEEPAGVAAASVAATAARADAAGADASAGSVETAKVDESGGEEAEEPAETKEPEAEESEAAEPEAEEPEAELEEPGTEEPAAEQPAPEAVAEPEAEEAQAAEPEEAGAEEPAPEETEAQETETQEPEASDAEKLDADPETAETAEPDESEPEPDEAAETDESEPEPEAEAGDVTPEEPAGETPGTTSGGDDTGTRRRWALRRRSRRSRG
ncbi:prolipoprotein diacylglyceryl transferase [Mycobacterium genavense]|uniref:prolipoprotein diacylglyceryl transferase n=1 Tax=Mycobacterium genavense TaxID=36812 RepID=UPI000470B359|nr:prolipoprotein diacylglyceryl transferase [Mycobacterium genavense]